MIDILLVDDDKLMSQTLADILELKGYRAETANSAKEALEKIKSSKYDCVISDIKMPGENGVDLFTKIRELDPEMPVALMTAYARDELVQRGLDEGVIGVFSKPLDLNLVFDLLSFIVSKVKILLVDDDQNFCETMKSVLQLIGHNDVTLCDLSNLEDNLSEISLVLLDVKLPNSTCTEVYQRIRSFSPDVAVVLITNYQKEMIDEIFSILKTNASGILEKPIDEMKLINLINKVKKSEMKSRIYPKNPKEKVMLDQGK